MKKHIFFILLTASLFFSGFSQSEFVHDFSNDREKAFTQIALLKNGALIVRFRTQDRKIEAYRNAGNIKLANQLEKELSDFNKALAQAFKTYYQFSKVFFMYPADYSKFLEGDTVGYFYNYNLELDTTIAIDRLDDFFICEYGPVYAEDIIDPNNARTKVVTSTPMLQDALVIKDTDLNQLLSPFPNHVSIRLKTIEKSVENLDRNLQKFFNRALERNQ